MKCLKVFALPGGRLTTRYRENGLPPIDEGWWQDVLHDPRAHFPTELSRLAEGSPHASYRLDRQRGEELLINCGCGRSHIANRAELIEALGGDCNVAWLARKLIECPRRNKIGNACLAYCVR